MKRPPCPAVALLLGLAACTGNRASELTGVYRGMDGSNRLPSQVEWTLAKTGDGLLSGIWKSSGEITQAQLSGALGYFGNDLTLHVTAGACTGDFHGDLHEKDGELTGRLQGNPGCPDRVYAFALKKTP